mgnify:CR=1 FL=1
MKSILSDVVSKYSRHTENICSESLALVVNESVVLKESLRSIIQAKSNGHLKLQNNFSLQVQVTSSSDTAIPDLQIEDRSGNINLVEAKFWAGLTEHQPNGYIRRIGQSSGCLIFLVPERRIAALTNELELKLKSEFITAREGGILLVNSKIPVFLVSWTEVIEHLWNSASTKGESEILHNLYQLRGLIQKLDSEGFIPFESALFTPMAGKQRDQLIDLIDASVENILELDTKKLSYGGGKYTYQRFFKMHGKYGGHMVYSSDLWMKNQDTPVYFCISTKPWNSSDPTPNIPLIEEFLKEHGILYYPEVEISNYPSLAVAVPIPLSKTKEDSLDTITGFIRNVIELISKAI